MGPSKVIYKRPAKGATVNAYSCPPSVKWLYKKLILSTNVSFILLRQYIPEWP